MRKFTLLMLLMASTFVFGKDLVALNKNVSTLNGPKEINNIKICALRVDFQVDDKEITSGTGKFLYIPETDDTLNSKFKIDPVPHNRTYFKDHIQSLANFYNHASNGKLTIDAGNSEVYPLNDSEYFTVSKQMDYYNPFLVEDSVDIRLAELFIESVQLADNDVNFADYDVVVIFHAGVGQDFAVDLDPTPYDIPSAFLNPNDIKKAVSNPGSFNGISVDNGNTLLNECIILPETQNHTLYEKWDEVFYTDDAFNVQVGLNGTFAFMFGFYLGIPGMYNTETGDAGIGRWGMMDQGSVNLNGLVPALPNAWIREYMGWINPIEAIYGGDVKLAHAESESDTLAWKIRIDDDEYFLVENRCNFIRDNWNLDSIRNKIYEDLPRDSDFPSILPLVKDSIGAVFSEETGVLLSVPRYDYGLPGSGLLIWHIDETVINANLETNSVNNDRERRGVHLEEGDGAVDIGFPPANMFSDVHNGWGFDAWFAGNEGFWDINKNFYGSEDSAFVGFTDYTFPSTKNNDNVYTGISIDKIGQSGETMEFVIDFDAKDGQFPMAVENVKAMAFCDYDNDGNEDMIIVSDDIYLYNGNGEFVSKCLYYSENIGDIEIALDGDQLYMAFENGNNVHIKEFTISENGNISDNNEDTTSLSQSEITSNMLIVDGSLTFAINGSTGSTIKQNSSNFGVNSHIIKIGNFQNQLFFLTDDYKVLLSENVISESSIESIYYDAEGTVQSMAAYLSSDKYVNLVITTDDNLVLIHNLTSDDREVNSIEFKCHSNPIISDINGDGNNDIIVVSDGVIYAFDENFILLQNFPIDMPNLFKGQLFDKTIYTANVDGNDETLEIIASIRNIGVAAFNYEGELVDGFPIATIRPKPKTGMSGLYSKDGSTYFLSIGYHEMNSVKISENSFDERSWAKNGYDGNSYYYSYQPTVTVDTDKSLLNKKKTFCWPNPVETDECYLRYWVSEDCDITINIFNMAGQFVKSFSQSDPHVNQYNEITWNVADIQSGVYFAIIKAEKGSKSETETEKIMIIK